MSEETERRIRDALRSASLPAAPDSLRAALQEIPSASATAPRGTGLPRGWLVPVVLGTVLVIALAGIVVSGRQPAPTSPSASPSTSLPATPSATTAPVVLPVNAPLEPTACGWPATTPLAFAGYATVADLDAGQIIQDSPNEHVYALVTRDPVELVPMIGSPMLERGFCAIRQDGSQTESAVGADWTFNGMPQNPVVTCEGTATSCVRATLVVLDAVASVGHPATRITFRADEMCIGAPFGGRPCAAPAWPDGTQRMTSAVATFSGTEQQAFLSLFWRADGSLISAGYLVLEAPPLGATPFP